MDALSAPVPVAVAGRAGYVIRGWVGDGAGDLLRVGLADAGPGVRSFCDAPASMAAGRWYLGGLRWPVVLKRTIDRASARSCTSPRFLRKASSTSSVRSK